MNQTKPQTELVAIIPAAGVGKRMQANMPKQYLKIGHSTILEHTVAKLSKVPSITQIILVVSKDDPYIKSIQPQLPDNLILVEGGQERVDSVLAGLKSVDAHNYKWCLVHDAARPCVLPQDIEKLIISCLDKQQGGILATPVRDTMKRARNYPSDSLALIETTEDRESLWHALTPQMFPLTELIYAIEVGLKNKAVITDEASAMELVNADIQLVEADASNIKITRASDLALAEFFLNREINEN